MKTPVCTKDAGELLSMPATVCCISSVDGGVVIELAVGDIPLMPMLLDREGCERMLHGINAAVADATHPHQLRHP